MPEANPASGVPAATSMTASPSPAIPRSMAARCTVGHAVLQPVTAWKSEWPAHIARPSGTSVSESRQASPRSDATLCARRSPSARPAAVAMTDARARAVSNVVPTTVDGERTHAGATMAAAPANPPTTTTRARAARSGRLREQPDRRAQPIAPEVGPRNRREHADVVMRTGAHAVQTERAVHVPGFSRDV